MRLLPAGAALAGVEAFRSAAEMTAYHQCEVSRVRLRLEARPAPSLGRLTHWESERAFRSDLDALGLRRQQGNAVHVSDGVATYENGDRVAVEVERSVKAPARLARIVEDLLTEYPVTLYAVASGEIAAGCAGRRAGRAGKPGAASAFRRSDRCAVHHQHSGVGAVMQFYLGTHHPAWLASAPVPLFVSDRRLRGYKRLPRAGVSWALDSGGFTELFQHGSSQQGPTPAQYVAQIRRYYDEVGKLDWAASQDWMCEPWILKKTGLSIAEHHDRTVDNYVRLRDLAVAADVPEDLIWPTAQEWEPDDFLRCVDRYYRAGVDLSRPDCRGRHRVSPPGNRRRRPHPLRPT